VQNVHNLAGAWADIQKALEDMHRKIYIMGRCRGGFKALETTIGSDGRWNAQELLDGDFLAQFTITDIAWRAGRSEIKQPHPGLAGIGD